MQKHLVAQFADLVAARLGLCLREQEHGSIWRAVSKRVSALKLVSIEAYLSVLAGDGTPLVCELEWQELIKLLTVSETYFFRDQGQFSLLKEVILPELIQRKLETTISSGRPSLRVWSAGCASGEEAYSLAILIADQLANWQEWDISVLGTDLSQTILERAQRGVYGEWSFRAVPLSLRNSYFRAHRDGWEVLPQIRQMVTFQVDNLLQNESFKPDTHNLDLILCRNVFIYFTPVAIAQVLDRFHQALSPYGYLMTGHAELHGQRIHPFRLHSFQQSVVYQRGTARVEPAIANQSTSPSKLPAIPFPDVHTIVARSSAIASATRPPTTPPPWSAEVEPLDHLKKLIAHKSYLQAIAYGKELIQQQPKNLQAFCLLAEAYANSGDYANANQICQQVIKAEPLTLDPYYLLAQVAEEQGQSDEAIYWLKRIIYLAPQAVTAYLDLSSLYEQKGNDAKAKTTRRTVLNLVNQMAPDTIVDRQRQLTAGELKTFLETRSPVTIQTPE